MKSVLIINSEIYDKYQRYAHFFDWFEDNKDISVCVWNKFASEKADIDELVPQLFDIIKNVNEWNAYIVDEPFDSGRYMEKDFGHLTQRSLNPYERAGLNEAYDPTADQFMRLMYFLGGRGIEELEYVNNYTFNASRPTQIFLLTPRIFENLDMQKSFLQSKIEEKNRKHLDDMGFLLTESDMLSLQYSEFWERYDYPPNCRFMVFDMPCRESVKYEDSWFLLWLSTMMVILNTYSSSELEPYKLHRLSVDVSAKELEKFLNKFYSALHNACEVSEKDIENEIKALKAAMEDTTSNRMADCASVYVNFPDTDFSKFFPPKDSFGDTKDKPELDTDVWRKHKEDSVKEIHALFKSITRGKNEAVETMNRTFAADIPLLKNQHLTRYDVEDIVEELNRNEIDMVRLETDKKHSRAAFENDERKASKDIENVISGRVFSSTYFKLLSVGVIICLLGFIPFIVSSAKFNSTSFLVSLLITALALLSVVGAGFLALKIRRKRLDDKFDKYSEAVSENISKMKDNAQIQGKYLTHLLNYMEKYQMLKSVKIYEQYSKHLEELTRIHSLYEEALSQCKSIVGLCSGEICFDDEVEAENLLQGDKVYIHEDTDSMLIPLDSIPNRLVTSFPFVKSFSITTETLYESTEYYSVYNAEMDADRKEQHDNE